MAKKRKQPKKRRRSIDVDTPLKDAIASTFSLSVERLSDLESNEEAAVRRFAERLPDQHRLLSAVYLLHRLLMESRLTLQDRSDLRSALDLLGAKVFADARGAYILLATGYPIASLGPLRAAAEASDLMAYFLSRPDEVEAWQKEEAKFDSLGWIRKELPHDPTPTYEFLAFGMHANWRLIPPLMTDETDPLSAHYEISLGPSANTEVIDFLAVGAAFELMKAVAVLYDHRPDLVSPIWVDEYEKRRSQLAAWIHKAIETATESLALRTLVAVATRSSASAAGTDQRSEG